MSVASGSGSGSSHAAHSEPSFSSHLKQNILMNLRHMERDTASMLIREIAAISGDRTEVTAVSYYLPRVAGVDKGFVAAGHKLLGQLIADYLKDEDFRTFHKNNYHIFMKEGIQDHEFTAMRFKPNQITITGLGEGEPFNDHEMVLWISAPRVAHTLIKPLLNYLLPNAIKYATITALIDPADYKCNMYLEPPNNNAAGTSMFGTFGTTNTLEHTYSNPCRGNIVLLAEFKINDKIFPLGAFFAAYTGMFGTTSAALADLGLPFFQLTRTPSKETVLPLMFNKLENNKDICASVNQHADWIATHLGVIMFDPMAMDSDISEYARRMMTEFTRVNNMEEVSNFLAIFMMLSKNGYSPLGFGLCANYHEAKDVRSLINHLTHTFEYVKQIILVGFFNSFKLIRQCKCDCEQFDAVIVSDQMYRNFRDFQLRTSDQHPNPRFKAEGCHTTAVVNENGSLLNIASASDDDIMWGVPIDVINDGGDVMTLTPCQLKNKTVCYHQNTLGMAEKPEKVFARFQRNKKLYGRQSQMWYTREVYKATTLPAANGEEDELDDGSAAVVEKFSLLDFGVWAWEYR